MNILEIQLQENIFNYLIIDIKVEYIQNNEPNPNIGKKLINTANEFPTGDQFYFSQLFGTTGKIRVNQRILGTLYNVNKDMVIINLRYFSNIMVIENIVKNNSITGISLNQMNQTKVINNTIERNGMIGLSANKGGTNSYEGNYIQYNRFHGVFINNEQNSRIGGTFKENYITINDGYGIWIQNCYNNVELISNLITNNSKDGVLILSNNIKIELNTISDNRQNGLKNIGSGNIILNNEFMGNGENGLVIEGDNNYLTSTAAKNIAYNSKTGAVINGTGNKIQGGIFSYNEISGIDVYGFNNSFTSITNNYNRIFGIRVDGSSHIFSLINFADRGFYFIPSINATMLKSHNFFTNRINGQLIAYVTDDSQIISTGYSQVIAVDVNGLQINSINFINTTMGIQLLHCTNVYISSILIQNNTYRGIIGYSSANVIIDNCSIQNVPIGIDIDINVITIKNSNITNITDAAIVATGISTIVENCQISNSTKNGIEFYGENQIITFSKFTGILIYSTLLNGKNTIVKDSYFNLQNAQSAIYALNQISGQIFNNTIQILPGIGILVQESAYLTIEKNSVSSLSIETIKLDRSRVITLTRNSLYGSGLYIVGNSIEDYDSHYIPPTNIFAFKNILYFKNLVGSDLSSNGSQFILVNCQNVVLKNINIQSAPIGILLVSSTGNSITGTISGSLYSGIEEYQSQNNRYSKVIVMGSKHYGLYSVNSIGLEIIDSEFVINLKGGINVINSTNTYITKTTIKGSNNLDTGINFQNSRELRVSSCNFNDGSIMMKFTNITNGLVEMLTMSTTRISVFESNSTNNLIIRNNTITSGTGILAKINNSLYTRLERMNYYTSEALYGIIIDSQSPGVIVDRILIEFTFLKSTSQGIVVNSNSVKITTCEIIRAGNGIVLTQSNNNSISFTEIKNGSRGILLNRTDTIKINDNHVISMEIYGIWIINSSNIDILNNILNNNYLIYRIENSNSVNIRFNSYCGNINYREAVTSTYDDRFNSVCDPTISNGSSTSTTNSYRTDSGYDPLDFGEYNINLTTTTIGAGIVVGILAISGLLSRKRHPHYFAGKD
jgi:parallel beta-helix repeat protein